MHKAAASAKRKHKMAVSANCRLTADPAFLRICIECSEAASSASFATFSQLSNKDRVAPLHRNSCLQISFGSIKRRLLPAAGRKHKVAVTAILCFKAHDDTTTPQHRRRRRRQDYGSCRARTR